MTTADRAPGDPLPRYASAMVAVSAAGLLLAYFIPSRHEPKLAALIGVAAAALSGIVALTLKRWAAARSTNAALGVVAAVFGLRLLLVVLGLVLILNQPLPTIPYVLGFFGTYFPLQWIEIAFVLAERRRHEAGGP